MEYITMTMEPNMKAAGSKENMKVKGQKRGKMARSMKEIL